MGEEKRIFGYARTVTSDQLNGQLLIKEDEAVVVKYIFSKLKEYLENPPKEMWHQHMRFPRCCLTVQNMKSRCFWILFWPLKVP